MIAPDLQEIEELWHKNAFAGRKGRGVIDSVMLIDHLRGPVRKNVYRRNIHSAFNSINTTIMCDLLKESPDLQRWVHEFLAPRSFRIKTDRVIGRARMVGGTSHGSPLSPSIFRIYMSAMVKGAEERDSAAGKQAALETRG